MVDPISMLPDSTKERLLDATISGLARLADLLPGNSGRNLRRLKSDGKFYSAFYAAIATVLNKFYEEYSQVDPDLVRSLPRDASFWSSDALARSLEELIARPGGDNRQQRRKLQDALEKALTVSFPEDRCEYAIDFLLRCLADEVWYIPQLQPTYSLYVQRITAEQTSSIASELKGLRADTQLLTDKLYPQLADGQKPGLLAISASAPQPSKRASSSRTPGDQTDNDTDLDDIREELISDPIQGLVRLEGYLRKNELDERLADLNLWRSELTDINLRRRRFGRSTDDEIRWRQIVYEVLRMIGELQ